MTLIHDCIPCQYGNHDKHHRVVESVPEGMLGGQECHCDGECRERANRPGPVVESPPDDYARVVEQIQRVFG